MTRIGGYPAAARVPIDQTIHVQEAVVAETGSQSSQPDRVDEVSPAAVPATVELVGGGFEVGSEAVDPSFTVLHVIGELDMATAPELAEHVQRHFAPGAATADRTLVFDLTGVSFLGSAGLAVLAEAANLAGAHKTAVRVVASSRSVARPIEVTGLDRVLRMFADLAQALS